MDNEQPGASNRTLLAVDLGLRAGFALYRGDGRLVSYRSQNFGARSRLRRAIPGILARQAPALAAVALEGPRPLAELWRAEARRRQLQTLHLSAETWRERLLLARQQRGGSMAKRSAVELAPRIIAWSGAPLPTGPLRHDAAEAVLVGLWAVLELGWLEALPPGLK